MPELTDNKNLHTCANCGAQFTGNVCSQCGEKAFHPSQLSVKNFVHQVFEIFTHFENKVLKSIWLTLSKPGLLTKQNLSGVRVSYAKPVQLFIVVNILFYRVVSAFHRTDYVPMLGDSNSNTVSTYPYFKWAKPYDELVHEKISELHQKKLQKFKNTDLTESIVGKQITDSSVRKMQTVYAEPVFITSYTTKVSVYAKTLIFILIPVFALVLYALFYRKLKYYGAALIFATHFLAFNLLLHSIFIIHNFVAARFISCIFGSNIQ